MRTDKTTPRSSSPEAVRLSCPRSWGELNPEQLRYALRLLALDGLTPDDVKTFCFIRFARLRVVSATPDGATFAVGRGRERRFFSLTNDEMTSFIRQLDFLLQPETFTCRLDVCAGRKAVDALLYGVDFRSYLTLENYYQAYLADPADTEALSLMGDILYTDAAEKTAFEPWELINVFLWYTNVKHQLAQEFPRLFAPASDGQAPADMNSLMNRQVRALTGGDVTKEEQVFSTDLRRALAELEAKIVDADDLRRHNHTLKS